MATFTNRATLSYGGRTVDSNTVTGTFLQTLSIIKTALSGTYAAGDTVTYVVTLSNAGATPLNGLTLTDNLGAFDFNGTTLYPLAPVAGAILYYVDGVLQPALTPVQTQPLVLQGITVPAGGNAIIVYETEVTDVAALDVDAGITNTATVSGCGLLEPLSDSATVTTADAPLLTITKALSPVAVPENGTLTYTFVIQNFGNTAAVATDDVVVTDNFDPILENLTVTLDGTVLAEGTGYTYNAATGAFSSAPSVITVPAATFVRNADGTIAVTPGEAVLTVSGTI
jgi:uncharacterized repeat protein (TIGR01451 family)